MAGSVAKCCLGWSGCVYVWKPEWGNYTRLDVVFMAVLSHPHHGSLLYFPPFFFSPTIWTIYSFIWLPVPHLTSQPPPTPTFPLPSSEIFVHGDLQWDIFQVIISRSTTPDLIKIGMKLQEFFTQQFDTSKRALSTWGPGPYLPPKTPVINTEKGSAELCKHISSYTAGWKI